MTSITATSARRDLYNTIDRVNRESTPVHITNNRGKGAVLIGEDDWAAIEETLYLQSIPGMTESLEAGHKESLDECVAASDFGW